VVNGTNNSYMSKGKFDFSCHDPFKKDLTDPKLLNSTVYYAVCSK